jgi:hypothetical protein
MYYAKVREIAVKELGERQARDEAWNRAFTGGPENVERIASSLDEAVRKIAKAVDPKDVSALVKDGIVFLRTGQASAILKMGGRSLPMNTSETAIDVSIAKLVMDWTNKKPENAGNLNLTLMGLLLAGINLNSQSDEGPNDISILERFETLYEHYLVINGKKADSGKPEVMSDYLKAVISFSKHLLGLDIQSQADFVSKNWAMVTEMAEVGGIDFKSDRMDILDVKNEGDGIKFNLSPAQLKQFENVSGFTPVIINIQPVKDLPMFLGLDTPAASAS